jgi:hypothetical protein
MDENFVDIQAYERRGKFALLTMPGDLSKKFNGA